MKTIKILLCVLTFGALFFGGFIVLWRNGGWINLAAFSATIIGFSGIDAVIKWQRKIS